MKQRDHILIHNERMRLLAGFCNAIALGFLGFALLRPLVEATGLTIATVLWVITGLAFHVIAHYILGYMEKEAPNDLL